MPSKSTSRRDIIKAAGTLSALALATRPGWGVWGCAAMDEAGPSGSEPTPLLDELQRCPEDQRLARVMELMREQPLPFFEEMRRAKPVLRVGNKVVLVARYDDVVEVLSHPTTFTVKLYKAKMGDFMLTHDATETHRRDKAVMTAMIPYSDAPKIRALVAKYASEALSASQGRLEIVNQFARVIPLRLVQEYFGLDGAALTDLKRWSYWAQIDNFHNYPFQGRPDAEEISKRAAAEKKELVAYCMELVKRRAKELQADPEKDDVVSRMLRSRLPSSLGFGPDRVVVNCVGLLVGAVETTAHAMVYVVDELLRRPEELARASECARRNDFDAVADYAWEASRFKPISPYMFRLCEKPFTIAKGTERQALIEPETLVLVLTQSATFDAVEFEAPNEFRVGRPGYQSFLFGLDHHRCLGEPVAGQMIPQAVLELLKRRNLRRAPGAAGQIDYKGEWGAGPFPESMEVEFDA